MDRATLTQHYLDFLTEEGYRPSTDEDGDIVFKAEGKTYLIFIDEEDPGFFRMVFPNFWSVEDDAERKRVLEACNVATSQVKAVKIYVVFDNVWASVEGFHTSPEQATQVFKRNMGAIQQAVAVFVQRMRGVTFN